MYRTVLILMCGFSAVCLAHTEAEEDACVRELVRAYEGAVENSDCVEEDVPEGEDEGWDYPTINHLFATQLGPRCVSTAWTAEERRQAFENYMSRLSSKDRRQMSEDEILTCDYVFNICERFDYTNCLAAAKSVIVNEYAPERDSAVGFYFKHIEPSIEATDTAVFMATNIAAFSRSDRYYALKAYCQKVAQLPPTSSVFTNALERLDASRTAHMLYRPLDNLFIARDPTYEISSNRYELAIEALRYAKPNTPNERYFQSITNRLGRAIAP